MLQLLCGVLLVLVAPVHSGEAPELIVPPKPRVISAEGLDVNLTCKTTGKPDPILFWFKDEMQVSGGRFNILGDGTLHIKGVVLADASHYQCVAVNDYGWVKGEGTLVIRRKTRIEQKPVDLERNAGMDAKFTCSGTTDPEEVHNLRVFWLKDGDEILANDQRTTTNYQDNSLTISGTIVRDSGTYTCVATNGLDSANASAVLTVRAPMVAPTNFAVKDIGDTYADFTWEFPRSEIDSVDTKIRGEFMGFKIQYWQEGNKKETVRDFDVGPESAKNITGNTFSSRVGNMPPNTNTVAWIMVKNNVYTGFPSGIIRFKTKPGWR